MKLQSPYKFIVSPIGRQYNDTKKVGDVELLICNSIEEGIDVNRLAKVISIPENYNGEIKVDDTVVIGHNVFRISYDHKGFVQESDWYVKNKQFAIDKDLIYAIIRNGEFIPTDDNVFVEPMIEKDFWRGDIEAENVGFAKYVNTKLKSAGVQNGSKIAFKKGSKYIFEIHGTKFFVMKNRRIVAKLNEK